MHRRFVPPVVRTSAGCTGDSASLVRRRRELRTTLLSMPRHVFHYSEIFTGTVTASRARSPHPLALPTSFGPRHSGSRRYSRDPECPAHTPYFCNRAIPNLCKSCLLAFADKLAFGCVGATSATDVPTLSFTGVARKAWM